MKTTTLLIALGVLVFSCKGNENKTSEEADNTQTEIQSETRTETQPQETATDGEMPEATLDWDNIPDLKNIGNFPFVAAPQGVRIFEEKNGLTDLYDYETLEVYDGKGISTVEGKLGAITFEAADGTESGFNQKLFDRNIHGYLAQIGAKKLHEGQVGKENEEMRRRIRERLKKNMFSGKWTMHSMTADHNDDFLTLYAFKNNNKKYVMYVQSNIIQATVLIMELQDFVQTMQQYNGPTASEMQTDIEKTGKAILNIHFDTGKATLTPEGQQIVNEIYALLQNNPALNLAIEGHTDNTGTASLNKQLSIDRATTVRNELTQKGIADNRLKANGYGQDKPLKPNDTEANKAENRRVELVKF